MHFDLVIKNGLWFDGTGAPPQRRDLGVVDGRVAAIETALDAAGCQKVIDAEGAWVTPGFVDCHTHYDAELIAAPRLGESVRHGVTTVTVGSCSISAILAEPEDCSDLFTRVESVPRRYVLPLLESEKRWSSPREYVAFLEGHPLGPNIATFLGHSDLRTRVMGLGRAVSREARPTASELDEMERHLEDALDVGMLGLSTMTNPWDKLDGDRYRSKGLPSTYATWSEYRRLHKVLRRRKRILQSAPNITTKINALAFLAESTALLGDGGLKTTLITMADAKSSPGLHRVLGTVTRLVNRFFGGDLRWQTLPMPFEVYADGIDLVVFEEFGAGEEVLHLAGDLERRELMKDPRYRSSFREDYDKSLSPRVWQRDFSDAFIVDCPDRSVVGRSFGAVAEERGVHEVDAFLDLVVEHGTKLRWRTIIANHRPREVERMVSEPATLVGFSDAGAHIRNMAFYSFGLHMLKLVRDAERAGRAFMSVEKAVHRLTGEIADWFDIDAGHLRVGDRADVVILDPAALDERLGEYHEATMEGFGDLRRMVNRSEGVVRAVLINGQVAFEEGVFAPDLGRRTGYGQYLPAGREVSAGRSSVSRAA